MDNKKKANKLSDEIYLSIYKSGLSHGLTVAILEGIKLDILLNDGTVTIDGTIGPKHKK